MIGFGIYFLIKQLHLSIFENFYSWPTFLIIIGIAFLIHSYSHGEHSTIFAGVFLLGLGIHFHGLHNYDFWFDHWSVYPLIVGIAFLVRYLKTRNGLLPGIILVGISLFMIFSIKLPDEYKFIYQIIDFIETFWPVALIVLGIYLLKFKR